MIYAETLRANTSTHPISDEVLFVKIKHHGEYSAFENLYRKFYSALTNYAYRYMKSREKADDMVSEVFYKLWNKRSSIAVTTSLQSYLFTSVRNKCLDQLRTEGRVNQCDDSLLIEFDSACATPLQYTVGEELRKKIESAIEALPKDRRKIFRMSRDNGLKYKEIAATLGISIKTVETQMGRALRFLREELNEYIEM